MEIFKIFVTQESVARRAVSTALSAATSPGILPSLRENKGESRVSPVVVFVLGGPGETVLCFTLVGRKKIQKRDFAREEACQCQVCAF
jgi:hypothetical protein